MISTLRTIPGLVNGSSNEIVNVTDNKLTSERQITARGILQGGGRCIWIEAEVDSIDNIVN